MEVCKKDFEGLGIIVRCQLRDGSVPHNEVFWFLMHMIIWRTSFGKKKSRKGNFGGEYGVEKTLKIKEELLTILSTDLSSAPHPSISVISVIHPSYRQHPWQICHEVHSWGTDSPNSSKRRDFAEPHELAVWLCEKQTPLSSRGYHSSLTSTLQRTVEWLTSIHSQNKAWARFF